jgi:hypothetical protein
VGGMLSCRLQLGASPSSFWEESWAPVRLNSPAKSRYPTPIQQQGARGMVWEMEGASVSWSDFLWIHRPGLVPN